MHAVNLPGILNLVLLLVWHLSAPEITTSTMITRSKEPPTPPATPPTKAVFCDVGGVLSCVGEGVLTTGSREHIPSITITV